MYSTRNRSYRVASIWPILTYPPPQVSKYQRSTRGPNVGPEQVADHQQGRDQDGQRHEPAESDDGQDRMGEAGAHRYPGMPPITLGSYATRPGPV